MKTSGRKRKAALVGGPAMVRYCPAMQKNLPLGYRCGALPWLPALDLPHPSPHLPASAGSLGCAHLKPHILLTLLRLSREVIPRAALFSRTSQGMMFPCPVHLRPQLPAALSRWTDSPSQNNQWFSCLSHSKVLTFEASLHHPAQPLLSFFVNVNIGFFRISLNIQNPVQPFSQEPGA